MKEIRNPKSEIRNLKGKTAFHYSRFVRISGFGFRIYNTIHRAFCMIYLGFLPWPDTFAAGSAQESP